MIAMSYLWRDEGRSPPLTGLHVSVPAPCGVSALPEKYRDREKASEQNKDAPIFNRATSDFIACMPLKAEDSSYLRCCSKREARPIFFATFSDAVPKWTRGSSTDMARRSWCRSSEGRWTALWRAAARIWREDKSRCLPWAYSWLLGCFLLLSSRRIIGSRRRKAWNGSSKLLSKAGYSRWSIRCSRGALEWVFGSVIVILPRITKHALFLSYGVLREWHIVYVASKPKICPRQCGTPPCILVLCSQIFEILHVGTEPLLCSQLFSTRILGQCIHIREGYDFKEGIDDPLPPRACCCQRSWHRYEDYVTSRGQVV